jgi:hypothetical protein
VTDWRESAFCAGMADPTFATSDPFHPKHDDKDSDYEFARSLCARCPVTAECLADAMATETGTSRVGMRGGLTPMQRAALSRRRGRGTGVPADRAHEARMDLHSLGYSDADAARSLGIDPSSFRKWRGRHGLDANYSATGNREQVSA